MIKPTIFAVSITREAEPESAISGIHLPKAAARTAQFGMAKMGKDSHRRQLAAIHAYAKRAGFEVTLPPYYDAAVSGADPIDSRPGFAAMLAYLAEHSEVRTILVESAHRFARDLVVQLTGHSLLKERGIELIPVDAPEHFTDETPTAVMVRQILGAVSQFEKAALVHKLRVARERKRDATGRCEGRKSHAEARPEVVKEARKLRRKPKGGKHMPLRKVAEQLAKHGHLSSAGKPFSASAIKSMLAGD